MGRTLRALIVEDSEDDAQLIIKELRNAGYDPIVDRVESAKQMSAALEAQSWEVVLSDYKLPTFTAPAALAMLQTRRIDLPFIIVSGAIGEETAVAAMKAGAHDYLMKDNLARLGPVVERELREAKERRARRQAEVEIRQRNLELAALNAIAGVVSNSLDLDHILDRALEKTLEVVELSCGAVWVFDESSGGLPLVAQVGLSRSDQKALEEQAGIVFDLGPRHGRLLSKPLSEPWGPGGRAALPQVPSWEVALPLLSRGNPVGMLMLGDYGSHDLGSTWLSLLEGIAGLIGTAVENARLFYEVRQGRNRLQTLSSRLVEAQEAERRHLARELHDEIGQVLTSLKLTLEISKRSMADAARASLGQADILINELITRVRSLSMGLRPIMLDDQGLLPTLRWHLQRFQDQTEIEVDFQQSGLERRFEQEIETAAYRIVQEALTNVARHGRVREVRVRVRSDERILEVQVEDDGAGFDPERALAAATSSGLAGMRQRANLLGGQLRIESKPGQGTRLFGELPVTRPLERRLSSR